MKDAEELFLTNAGEQWCLILDSRSAWMRRAGCVRAWRTYGGTSPRRGHAGRRHMHSETDSRLEAQAAAACLLPRGHQSSQ